MWKAPGYSFPDTVNKRRGWNPDWTPITIGIGIFLFVLGLVIYLTINTKTCNETCTFAFKNYEPAHYHDYTTYPCVVYRTVRTRRANGSTSSSTECALRVPVNHHDFIPDKWSVQYRDMTGALDWWVDVDKGTYEDPPLKVAHQHSRWKQCPEGATEAK